MIKERIILILIILVSTTMIIFIIKIDFDYITIERIVNGVLGFIVGISIILFINTFK